MDFKILKAQIMLCKSLCISQKESLDNRFDAIIAEYESYSAKTLSTIRLNLPIEAYYTGNSLLDSVGVGFDFDNPKYKKYSEEKIAELHDKYLDEQEDLIEMLKSFGVGLSNKDYWSSSN